MASGAGRWRIGGGEGVSGYVPWMLVSLGVGWGRWVWGFVWRLRSVAGYLGHALDFVWNSAPRGKFNKIFILTGRMDTIFSNFLRS